MSSWYLYVIQAPKHLSAYGLSSFLLILLVHGWHVKVCHAQGPGYVGKYVPITAEYHFAPRIGDFLQGNGPIELNSRFSLRATYLNSRNLTIGWSVSRFHTHFTYQSDLTNQGGQAAISAWSTGPALRFFSYKRRGHMAPLGLYQQLELLYVRYQVQDEDRNYFPDATPDLGTYQDLIPLYSIGYQRIIHPSLIFNGSLQLGWLMNSFRSTAVDLRPIRTAATDRLRGFLLFNASIGIGFILF